MEGVCMDLYGDCMHEAPPPYKHIERNDFVYRKHVKQKDEDIVVCVCEFDEDDPDSACGDRCLNVLTSTECTPGYCPCGTYCNNQKFQKCQYAAVKLFKTEGRGWGLLASENIRVGQFVIEYCGEVISWNEAKRRSQEYEAAGLKDAFIICLHANEAIDATSKGSLARFINHSCQPNCETRKWTVLGEVRVGIFAKQDIPAGRELSYDYNFEWYGGSVVRCLCGASCCSGFLGAKSRGFQEATYLWEDDDDRYSVEKVPLYDSEEDDAASSKAIDSSKMALVAMAHAEYSSKLDGLDSYGLLPDAISAEPLNYIPVGDTSLNGHTIESMSNKSSSKQVGERNLAHKNTRLSPTGSRSAWRNDPVATRTLSKRFPNRKSKRLTNNDIDVKQIAEQLAWKEAREQLLAVEETKNLAASELESLYDEIRPSIEEHERDSQDSVPTGVAEKWIKASCLNFKADFDLYSTIIRTIAFTPRRGRGSHVSTPAAEGLSSSAKLEDENEIKYLEMG